MSKHFKIGFIGAGGQALEQMKAVHFSRFGRVAAVCDINVGKAIQAGLTFQVPYFSSYQNMIRKTDLDAVFICVPHNIHRSASLFALSQGLHVIKEKPFAITIIEGQELVEQARKYKRSLITVMQRRHHEIYKTGKKFMQYIGKPFLFRGSYTFNGFPYDFGWRGVKKIAGGGAVLDMGYHMLDLIIWYLGIPTQVFAQLSNIARPDVTYETEDTAILTFKIKDDLMGNLVLTRASHPKEEYIYIHGTKGTLQLNRYNVVLYDLDGSVRKHMKVDQEWIISVSKQIDDFIERIMEGEIEDGSSHLPHLHFIEAVYRSHSLGEPVRVFTNPFWITKKSKEVF